LVVSVSDLHLRVLIMWMYVIYLYPCTCFSPPALSLLLTFTKGDNLNALNNFFSRLMLSLLNLGLGMWASHIHKKKQSAWKSRLFTFILGGVAPPAVILGVAWSLYPIITAGCSRAGVFLQDQFVLHITATVELTLFIVIVLCVFVPLRVFDIVRFFLALTPVLRNVLHGLGMRCNALDCLYVNDGGHFDNLGIYELLRRRCQKIYSFDASEDKSYTYEALTAALRLAREDGIVDGFKFVGASAIREKREKERVM